jgi:hypothetical protein
MMSLEDKLKIAELTAECWRELRSAVRDAASDKPFAYANPADLLGLVNRQSKRISDAIDKVPD